MEAPLKGRCAVVTGAAKGMGAAYARAFAARGARVALVDRAPCGELLAELEAAGGDVGAFPCDLADPGEIAVTAVRLLDWRKGRLVLVNNAGIYPATPLETLDLAAWRSVFALNVEAPLLLGLALAEAMKADGWGRIINIGSSIVTLPRRNVAAYLSSKMAVIGLTRALASDLGPYGITVNTISPGLTRTHGTETQLGATGAAGLFDEFAGMQPVGRVIEAEDMTGMACFLAGDESAMMTGQTLLIDGGISRL